MKGNKKQCYSKRIHHLRHHKAPHHHRQPLHLQPMSSPSPSLSVHTHHQLQLKILIIPILMMIVRIIKRILLVTLFYRHHQWQPLTYLRRMISSSMATSSLSTSLFLLAPPQTRWTVSPSQSKTSYMTQSTPSETPASTATIKPPSPISTNLRSPPAIRTDPSLNPFHCLAYPSGKKGVTTTREKEMRIRIERETTARS